MAKRGRSEDQRPTTEQMLKGALRAQLQQAERIQRGGAHDVVAALPADLQRVVMSVVDGE